MVEKESPVFAERFGQRTMSDKNDQTVLFKKKYSSLIEESREMYPMLITVYHAKNSLRNQSA